MTTDKKNTILWVALIILISLSYFFAETSIKNAALLVGLISITKFLSVGFQSMEAKNANIIWQAMLVIFSLSYFLSIYIFY